MILIVSDNIAQTIIGYRKQIYGLSRCRLTGTLNGKPCRIVPRHIFSTSVVQVDEVIWDGFMPTLDEEQIAELRMKKAPAVVAGASQKE